MSFKLPEEIVKQRAQYNSIMFDGGPLMIIAGPGSGKTKVLVWRTIKLLAVDKIKPEEIWITTYTEKAADQLKAKISRVIKELGLDIQVSKLLIGTIHSTCLRLIKENPSYFQNIRFPPSILDDKRQLLFFLRHSRQLKLDRTCDCPAKRPDFASIIDVINHVNWLIEYEIDPDKYEDYVLSNLGKDESLMEQDMWMTRTYKAYLNLVRSEQLLDFGHILKNVADAVEHRKFDDVVSGKIRHILVDEYQDVNQLQQFIFESIAKKMRSLNITVVGDDDQAIYQFRGAGVGTLKEFEKRFNPHNEYLTTNFRSTPKIVSASSLVISTNPSPLRYPKNLIANFNKRNLDMGVVIAHGSDLRDSAQKIMKAILDLLKAKKIRSYGDIVLLMRSIKPHHINPYINCMDELDIPYIVFGRSGLFSTHVGLSFLLFYDFLAVPEAIITEQLARCEMLGLNSKTLQIFEKKDFEIKEKDIKAIKINDRDRIVLNTLFDLHKKRPSKISLLELTYEFLTLTGYLKRALDRDDVEVLEMISKITEIVLEFEEVSSSDIGSFTEYVRDLWKSGLAELPEYSLADPNYLKIMTIHQAKGLEFPVVVIGGAVKGRFPITNFGDSFFKPYNLARRQTYTESGVEEERRLFYVAMTRARDMLFFSTADMVSKDSKKKTSPSPWLQHIDRNDIETVESATKKVKDVLGANFEYEENPEVYSFSSLNYYTYCPFRYFVLRHIAFSFPIKGYFTIGSNIHSVLEYIHTQAMQGRVVREDEVKKIVKDSWVEAHDKLIPDKKLIESTTRKIQQYLRNYSSTFGNIIDVEKEFWIPIDDSIFTGKIDLIRKSATNNAELVDFKSGDYKNFDYEEQLKTYLMGAKYGLGIKSNTAVIHELSSGKVSNYVFSEGDINKNKDKIKNLIDKIKSGNFKATPSKEKCSKCELLEYNICPFAIK